MNIFYQPLITEGVLQLDDEESRHCIKVLRKKNGDHIKLTDGKGSFYDAVITSDSSPCKFEIRNKIQELEKSFKIRIAISPTKNADRIEWFVEKAVEFGVDEILMMECKNTERSYIKLERLKKMAISAMKQSLKSWLPEIKEVDSFSNIVNNSTAIDKFIAFVDQSNPVHLKDVAKSGHDCLVLIGPEGDFTSEELALALSKSFTKVSLGSSRLRTETAGLAACHILNLINS